MTGTHVSGIVLQLDRMTLRAGAVAVLRDISFSLARGQTFGLVGESGAGKSMIGRLISGLLPPDFGIAHGKVLFEGRDITNITPREAARAGLVHVIEGHRIFTQISVADNLLLAGYDLARGERAAREQLPAVLAAVARAQEKTVYHPSPKSE